MTPRLPLKRVADIRFSNVDKRIVDGQIPVQLCNYTDVYYNDRIRAGMAFMEATASAEQVRRFTLQAGDVLLTKDSETADDIGVTAFVPVTLRGVICGYHLAVVRPRPSIEGRFLHWALASTSARQQLAVAATGVTRFGLRADAVGSVTVPVPGLAAQGAIADYIDAETGRIDLIVDALRRQSLLIVERQRATVSSEMARAAESWLPLRRLATLVTSGPRGWAGYETDSPAALFLRIANVPPDGIRLRLDDVAYVRPPLGGEAARCRAQAGDVLATITAAIGQVAVVPDGLGEAYVSQHLALVRPARRVVEPNWLVLAMWTHDAQRQFDEARYGGTKQQLSLEDVRNIRVPIASLAVQRSVMERTLVRLETLGRLRERIDSVSRLLMERRQALITAAVTGQLAIPGVAA